MHVVWSGEWPLLCGQRLQAGRNILLRYIDRDVHRNFDLQPLSRMRYTGQSLLSGKSLLVGVLRISLRRHKLRQPHVRGCGRCLRHILLLDHGSQVRSRWNVLHDDVYQHRYVGRVWWAESGVLQVDLLPVHLQLQLLCGARYRLHVQRNSWLHVHQVRRPGAELLRVEHDEPARLRGSSQVRVFGQLLSLYGHADQHEHQYQYDDRDYDVDLYKYQHIDRDGA